jgi:membrane protein involved in colicin uptake
VKYSYKAMTMNASRRGLLRSASVALASIPLVVIARYARADTNEIMRAKLKYQAMPFDGKNCASCLEFIPDKSDKELGGCKQMPGDNEISPNGYCILWNTM